MCDSPHENVAQGAQWLFYLSATSVWATAAEFHLGSPVGTFFGYTTHCVPVQSLWCLCAATFVIKVGPKTPQGAQKVPKRSPKAHF